jgi:hypothetical protein
MFRIGLFASKAASIIAIQILLMRHRRSPYY